jgi:hypothetical protein
LRELPPDDVREAVGAPPLVLFERGAAEDFGQLAAGRAAQ